MFVSLDVIEVQAQMRSCNLRPHCLCALAVKDSELLEMTSLKKLPSETRTEALLVKYVAYFGICQ